MGALGRFGLREGHQETSSALNNGIASKKFVVAIGQWKAGQDGIFRLFWRGNVCRNPSLRFLSPRKVRDGLKATSRKKFVLFRLHRSDKGKGCG